MRTPRRPAAERGASDAHHHRALQDVVTRILALRPRFQLALSRAQNEAAGRDAEAGLAPAARDAPHDDDDAVRAMVRLFLDTTEAFQSLVATGRADVRLFFSLATALNIRSSHARRVGYHTG